MSTKKRATLLVMAAGMGSRYGGVKQMDAFGPGGETIMDYALFDALREGFGKVVFVVREEIRQAVEDMFFPKLSGKVEARCVTQSLDRFVPPSYRPVRRDKPWGTAHAVLCGKEAIDGPFAVINADDFYGRAAFRSLADFLGGGAEKNHAMVGYTLKDVLSDHGSVSRGIARQDTEGYLIALEETTEIVRQKDGSIVAGGGGAPQTLVPSLKASMNAWGFMPDIFDSLESMFAEFAGVHRDSPKAEFYIGSPVTELIEKGAAKVHVIPGGDTWFGVTYRADKDAVSKKIADLVRRGEYPQRLW